MRKIGPCLILWVEFDYRAPMDEAASSGFGSLLHPYWRESEVQLTKKQAVLLMHDIYIPGRTVAVLNVNSSVHQNDIGQFYNVRANSLLEDEYPQLQIIATLHKVDNTNTTLIPFVMINLGEDYIFLPKGQVVGFLDAECIDVSEIELDIATVTVNAMDNQLP